MQSPIGSAPIQSLSVSHLSSQGPDVCRDARKSLLVRILDDRRHEPRRCLYRHTDVDVDVLPSEVLLPRAVHTRHLLQRKRGGLDDKVVHRDLARRGRRVDLLPQLEHRVHLALDGEVVVRDGLLGLEQALGGDAADLGVGDVRVRGAGCRGSS